MLKIKFKWRRIQIRIVKNEEKKIVNHLRFFFCFVVPVVGLIELQIDGLYEICVAFRFEITENSSNMNESAFDCFAEAKKFN